MTRAAKFRLRTLGGVDLLDSQGGRLLSVLSQPKRLALLVYLATATGGLLRRRDVVVSLFWPELDSDHARSALRQSLSYLRRALGGGVIVSHGEEIGVDPSSIRVDAAEFQSACAAGHAEEALVLYKGDFLDGFFVSDAAPELDRWLEDERNRLRLAARDACRMLVRRTVDSGDATSAISWARRAVAMAPNDEVELRTLIELLDRHGDRAGAVEIYDEFARRLAAEYEIEPSAETLAVIERVRTRNEPAPLAGVAAPRLATLTVAPPDAESLTDSKPPRRSGRTPYAWRQRPAAAAYLAMFGVLALAGYLLVFVASRNVSETDRIRIAVIPVADVDQDSASAYVADGLTEQLITELAQLRGLEVINARTMLTYRGQHATTLEILRDLGANVALTASIQKLGDTVHMTAQLVNAGDERAVWARTYEGTRADLLRLQQRVALSSARSLGVAVTAQENARGIDPAALDLYIRGRHSWNRRGRDALLRSIDLFTQALDVDPTFAPAYSGMGDAYVQLGYASLLRPEDAFLKARAAAQRALELDSTLAEPHATLAFVSFYFDWDWDGAEREFRRAVDRNPSYATAHEWYGLFLTAMGRFDEALAHERIAQQLDPLSVPIAGTAGWVLHYTGRQEDAARELRVALRQDSAFALGHFYLGRVHQARGEFDSALVHFEATGPLRQWVPTVAAVAYVLADTRRESEARALLSVMDSLARTEYVTAYAYALVHAALGQHDSAFAWLDRAATERTHWLVWLNRDTRWGRLRADPRFGDRGRQLGLPR